MKIRPLGAQLLHTDGQTDMTKPMVAFHNFANAPSYSGADKPLARTGFKSTRVGFSVDFYEYRY
jgi:hypothetical protein